ncbi:MAG: VWA domain-containing protein, partial [Nitrososphaerales archaeon]
GSHFLSKERRAEEELRISGRRIPFTSTGERGRVVGYDHPRGRSKDLSLLGTLLTSLRHVSKNEGLRIQEDDLMVHLRMNRAPFTMMLVLDLSESMMVHVKQIKNAITALHLKAYRQKDRLGLIALQGGVANLLFHPVTNLAVIAGGMDKLTGGGGTALADGLLKATDTLQLEQRRNLSSIFCVVLISDGLTTEPLSKSLETKTEGLSQLKSQEDVITVARILAKRRMPVISLNPLHIENWKEEDMISPTNLLKTVSRITGGSYFGFKSGFFRSEMNEHKMVDAVERGLSGIRV